MRTRFILLVVLTLFCQFLLAQSSQNDLTIYLVDFQKKEKYQLHFENAQGELLLTKEVDADKLILSDFDVRKFWVKVYANNEQISAQFFQLSDSQESILINPNVEKTFALSQVIIKTEEKAIEVKGDRIVYHMQSSAFQKGFNSVEVLQKVPFVRVIGGGISIVGKGKVTITINDKKVHFSDTQLLEYLKTIPSERITKIEVITNPPAKYDSYGNGGVINIQLKPAKHDGYALLLSSSFTQRQYANFRNNANLNYHKEKWNINLNFNYARKKSDYDDYSRFVNADSLLRETNKSEVETTHQFLVSARADYQVNNTTDLGLVYTHIQSRDEGKTNRQIFLPEEGKKFHLLNNNANIWKNVLNLYMDIKLDTIGSKLSFLGTYIHNQADKRHKSTSFQFDNVRQQKNNIYEFEGLLETPLSESFKIDFGVDLTKATDIVFNQSQLEGDKHTFDYNEFTYDLFFDFYWDINDALTLSGGLKYEGLERKIEEIGIHKNFVLPTFNIVYKPDQKNSLSLSYSKRIEKPYLSYLDPYKIYTAPHTYYVGNPYLDPYTINNVELRYIYNSKLFFTVYSQTYNELFGTVTKLVGGDQVETKENYYDSQQYGAIISYFYRNLDWWNFQLVNHTFYHIPKEMADQFKSFEGLTSAFYVNNYFYLNSDKSTVLGFSYFYNLPGKTANGKYDSFATFNIDFKTSIIKELLQLKLSIVDLFNQQYRKGRTYFSNGDIYHYNLNNDTRHFNITLTFNIGNKKPTKTIQNKTRIKK